MILYRVNTRKSSESFFYSLIFVELLLFYLTTMIYFCYIFKVTEFLTVKVDETLIRQHPNIYRRYQVLKRRSQIIRFFRNYIFHLEKKCGSNPFFCDDDKWELSRFWTTLELDFHSFRVEWLTFNRLFEQVLQLELIDIALDAWHWENRQSDSRRPSIGILLYLFVVAVVAVVVVVADRIGCVSSVFIGPFPKASPNANVRQVGTPSPSSARSPIANAIVSSPTACYRVFFFLVVIFLPSFFLLFQTSYRETFHILSYWALLNFSSFFSGPPRFFLFFNWFLYCRLRMFSMNIFIFRLWLTPLCNELGLPN